MSDQSFKASFKNYIRISSDKQTLTWSKDRWSYLIRFRATFSLIYSRMNFYKYNIQERCLYSIKTYSFSFETDLKIPAWNEIVRYIQFSSSLLLIIISAKWIPVTFNSTVWCCGIYKQIHFRYLHWASAVRRLFITWRHHVTWSNLAERGHI